MNVKMVEKKGKRYGCFLIEVLYDVHVLEWVCVCERERMGVQVTEETMFIYSKSSIRC